MERVREENEQDVGDRVSGSVRLEQFNPYSWERNEGEEKDLIFDVFYFFFF